MLFPIAHAFYNNKRSSLGMSWHRHYFQNFAACDCSVSIMCTNAAGLHQQQVGNHYYANVRNLLSVTSIYDITNKIQVPLSDLQQGSTMLPVDFNTYPKQDEHYAQRWSYGLYNNLQQSVAVFCDCAQTAHTK